MSTELKQFIQERCFDFGSLYSLEEEFNKIGLTIQPTRGGDMVLCQLVDDLPVAESLGVDHLFVGVQYRPRDEIQHKLAKCILEFIDSASGKSSKLSIPNRHPRTGHAGLYGQAPQAPQALGVGPVMQDMALSRAEIEECLLGAIEKWCDGL